MTHLDLGIEEKVAQLFVVGSDTTDLSEELDPLYQYGLGGILLFRNHVQPFDVAEDFREYLVQQKRRFKGVGLSFISIDQEGGQVERLPHWLFPTAVLPVALGLQNNLSLCQRMNHAMAMRLKWLGFNLNFTPTIDLNRETQNPIIGVRAYGSEPEQVIPFAKAVIAAHEAAGVMSVAKHFPGHGSGTVDSHIQLPVFESWQDDELTPFEALIREGLPGVMVAHGLYPKLARQLSADPQLPASLSEGVVTRLLREKLYFNGLVFTDDLMMGAVWGESDPVEVALQALQAGADMLVYRRAQPEALSAFEALVSRVKSGKFSEALLDEKVSRILSAAERYHRIPAKLEVNAEVMSQDACHAVSLSWAQEALIELQHQFVSPLPLSQYSQWGLVAPDRATMRHYAPDRKKGRGLLEWCQYYGVLPKKQCFYPVEEVDSSGFTLDWGKEPLETIVFVGFNSVRFPEQQALYHQLKRQYPQAKFILASCGMPSDREVLASPWVHVQLPSFRPSAMQAFVQWLITSPKRSV